MDGVNRLVREGKLSSDFTCPIVLVGNDEETIKGQTLFSQILRTYLTAIEQGRSQAKHAILVESEFSLGTYFETYESNVQMTLVSMLSDLFDWSRTSNHELEESRMKAIRLGKSTLEEIYNFLEFSHHQADGVPYLPANCLVFDSLSSFLDSYKLHQVLAFLERLRSSPWASCVLMLMNKGVHGAETERAIEAMATCTLHVSPLTALQQGVLQAACQRRPLGKLEIRTKRRSGGRLKVEEQLLCVRSSGELDVIPVPALTPELTQRLLTPGLRVNEDAGPRPPASRQGGSAAQGLDALTQAVGSSMRFTLTEEERKARDAVALPYEHQGASQVHRTSDFLDYLPQEAGGRGKVPHGKMGQILYVRDSDNDADSDEDPDDDLDI